MDDTQQQDSQNQTVQQHAQHPVTPVNQTQQPVSTPAAPIGSSQKEAGPSISQQHEYVSPVDMTPQLHQEVREHGVEVSTNHENPQLTHSHKQVGIQHTHVPTPEISDEKTPVPVQQFPLAQMEAEHIKKGRPISDSLRWLAELVLEQMKKTHQQLLRSK